MNSGKPPKYCAPTYVSVLSQVGYVLGALPFLGFNSDPPDRKYLEQATIAALQGRYNAVFAGEDLFRLPPEQVVRKINRLQIKGQIKRAGLRADDGALADPNDLSLLKVRIFVLHNKNGNRVTPAHAGIDALRSHLKECRAEGMPCMPCVSNVEWEGFVLGRVSCNGGSKFSLAAVFSGNLPLPNGNQFVCDDDVVLASFLVNGVEKGGVELIVLKPQGPVVIPVKHVREAGQLFLETLGKFYDAMNIASVAMHEALRAWAGSPEGVAKKLTAGVSHNPGSASQIGAACWHNFKERAERQPNVVVEVDEALKETCSTITSGRGVTALQAVEGSAEDLLSDWRVILMYNTLISTLKEKSWTTQLARYMLEYFQTEPLASRSDVQVKIRVSVALAAVRIETAVGEANTANTPQPLKNAVEKLLVRAHALATNIDEVYRHGVGGLDLMLYEDAITLVSYVYLVAAVMQALARHHLSQAPFALQHAGIGNPTALTQDAANVPDAVGTFLDAFTTATGDDRTIAHEIRSALIEKLNGVLPKERADKTWTDVYNQFARDAAQMLRRPAASKGREDGISRAISAAPASRSIANDDWMDLLSRPGTYALQNALSGTTATLIKSATDSSVQLVANNRTMLFHLPGEGPLLTEALRQYHDSSTAPRLVLQSTPSPASSHLPSLTLKLVEKGQIRSVKTAKFDGMPSWGFPPAGGVHSVISSTGDVTSPNPSDVSDIFGAVYPKRPPTKIHHLPSGSTLEREQKGWTLSTQNNSKRYTVAFVGRLYPHDPKPDLPYLLLDLTGISKNAASSEQTLTVDDEESLLSMLVQRNEDARAKMIGKQMNALGQWIPISLPHGIKNFAMASIALSSNLSCMENRKKAAGIIIQQPQTERRAVASTVTQSSAGEYEVEFDENQPASSPSAASPKKAHAASTDAGGPFSSTGFGAPIKGPLDLEF